jgi:molecular chaperone DnaK
VEDDKRKRELIEARNQADSFVYSVEKNVKEFGDKIDASAKAKIEAAIGRVKTAMDGDDVSAIRSAQEELTQASHKLAEAMYAKTAQQQAGPQAGPSQKAGAAEGKKDEDVVDAEFEEGK